MTDATDPPKAEDIETDDGEAAAAPVWDAVEVMRTRAAATREERDAAIAELRDAMSDQQVLDKFGINLHQIEE